MDDRFRQNSLQLRTSEKPAAASTRWGKDGQFISMLEPYPAIDASPYCNAL